MKRIIMLLICISVFIHSGLSSSPGLQFLKTPMGAKAIALGSAFTSIADDPSAVYWNPAGLTQVEGLNIYLTKNILSLDRTFTFASVTKSEILWFDTLSIGILHAGTMKINQYDEKNNFIKEFSDNNIACYFSVAKKISGLDCGTNLKLIYQSMLDESSIGLGLDFGILYTYNKLRLGLLLQDPYTFTVWQSGHIDTAAMTLKLGAGYHISNYITLCGNLERTNVNEITKISAGVEAKTLLGLSIRCLIPFDILLPFGTSQNVSYENLFAIGVGFNVWKVTVDYTYKVDTFKVYDSHIFSLNLHF